MEKDVPVPETALVFPLLPGKRLALQQFVHALLHERQSEHDCSHRTIAEERWFVQALPEGEVVIVYLKGPDPAFVFADLAVSEEPFAVWFREKVLDITGVNLALLPPFDLPQCIFQRSRTHSLSGGA